jgi:hypothetical protein
MALCAGGEMERAGSIEHGTPCGEFYTKSDFHPIPLVDF